MLGPNFHAPASPNVKSYSAKPLPKKTVAAPSVGKGGIAQQFVYGADIRADWWYLFKSPKLNQLIQIGLNNNPNLAAAYASLRVAQEALNVQIGNSLFPAVTLAPTVTRQKFSDATLGVNSESLFNLYNASVNVSYILDVFGGERRQIESLRAQVDNQQFELIAVYITLTANIVTTTVAIASFQEQIIATKDLLKAQENQLNILQQQLKLGGISQDTVLTQQTLVNQTRANLPPLEKSLAESQHALLALIGEYPDKSLPIIRLSDLTLPKRLPVSLPSRIVRQRPDVRASEALLHAAMAQIGVATANLFPQFNLTATYGWESNFPSDLFSVHSNIWSLGAQITQPLFNGGALFAARRQAIAAFDKARAQYRQVVLQAFQNVSDSLHALAFDAKALYAQKNAEISAYRNLNLSTQQYRLGGTSYLALLNAQQQYQTVRISRIQAQAARYADTAALFQALGGGWWNKEWCVTQCLYEHE